MILRRINPDAVIVAVVAVVCAVVSSALLWMLVSAAQFKSEIDRGQIIDRLKDQVRILSKENDELRTMRYGEVVPARQQ